MSGGNCPETPRQKMIGMMYLFLTAMLAINVSSTVLKGFTLVDESLRSNNEIFFANNNEIYSKFAFEYKNNPVKFNDSYLESLEIKKRAESLYALIDSAKWKLARVTDGEQGDPYHLIGKDNVDAGFEAFIFELPGNTEPTTAELMKGGLKDYENYLLENIVKDTVKFRSLTSSIIKSLDTSDPENSSDPHGEENLKWEDVMFTGIPVGAVLALMSKMQTDIRNTESLALSHLLSQVTAGDINVNKIESHLITSSSYLVKGSTLTMQALLAATDSTQVPEYKLQINGTTIKGDGNGNFSIPTTSTGMFEITGQIISHDENGDPVEYKINQTTFEVVEPFATVSATKMNVLYAGVENPVSISVPGFSAKDIKPSLSDGSPFISKGTGYIAKPKTPGKDIEVIVEAIIEGKTTIVGRYPFRIKSLPPPTAFVQYPKETTNTAGKKITLKEKFPGGRLRKKDLLNASGVVADLQNSDFAVNYKILGFDMTFYDTMGNAKTYTSTNSKFTKDQINKIKTLTKGKQFFISNVKAVGPDGIPKRLSAIDITLN